MNSNILLAVDVASGRSPANADSAAQLARELVRDSADHVVVLYVREFSVLQIGRMMADRGGTAGQHAVDGIVARLRAGGVSASGLVREADAGHVAQVITGAARDIDARVIVVGSGRRASAQALPHLPRGSLTARVLHLATLPVLVVPDAGQLAVTDLPVVSMAAPGAAGASALAGTP
jgi:nucleotide-binding universal stress UspA family protein